ncbi:MAG: SNF2-related protein [Vicinamibacterales bacterium]
MKTYGTLTWADNVWTIDAAPHVAMRAKRIFARLEKKARGKLKVRSTPDVCRDLEWLLDRYPLEMSDRDRKVLTVAANGYREQMQRLEDLFSGAYAPPSFDLAKPPRSYQAKEAAILLEHGGVLVGDEVGLGKTVTAICAMSDPRALPAVVVCQPHIARQWAAKVEEFAPDLRVHVLRKSTPYALPKWFGRDPDVVVCSYHKLGGWAPWLAQWARFIVFDEIQEMRHTGTQKYIAAETVASAMAYRLGLSATPVYNYGGEIFGVLELLKPGALGSADEFFTEWCSGYDYRKAKLKSPKAFGAWARDQFLIVRHTRKEVGRELPAVQRITQTVDTDMDPIRAVESTAADLARTILATEALDKGVRWQASEQLSTLLRQATGIAKAPHVANFVRLLVEQGERPVVCAWHREVYRVLQEKLEDLKPVLYTGTETAAQKSAAAEAFIDGKAKVLLLSLRSGAGLDGLQAASSCIVFAELDWSPGVHEQCIGRLNRDGQDTPVVAYFLVSDKGADPAIAEVLGIKQEQIEGIRSPEADYLEEVGGDTDRVRALAEAYLRQIGHTVPAAAEAAAVTA